MKDYARRREDKRDALGLSFGGPRRRSGVVGLQSSRWPHGGRRQEPRAIRSPSVAPGEMLLIRGDACDVRGR
ncbi:MAG TPA: hypothetical protein VGY54_21255, partial [Polyangiaceae bacterium]|nr:hypothetical protein [Polyangiaceae bacterium]